MNKLDRRVFDNISNISPSKSSKTIKSKIHTAQQQQVVNYQPPYFKEDPIRIEIENRLRKQQLKGGKGQKHQLNTDRIKPPARIVTELLRKHEQVQEKLNKMKEEAEDKIKKECSFQPEKKKLEKYYVGGDILRRNQHWMLQRRRKEMERKQNKVADDLSECTFQPVLLAKKTSQIYLRNRSFSTHSFMKKKDPSGQIDGKGTPVTVKKGDISQGVFESGKKRITDKIFKLL